MFNLKKKIINSKPVKNWKRYKKKKLTAMQSMNIAFGTQDQVDLISYAGLKEESSYLQLNDRYIRTFFIS